MTTASCAVCAARGAPPSRALSCASLFARRATFEQQRASARPPTVVWTIADDVWAAAVPRWVYAARTLARTATPAAAVGDAGTAALFARHGVGHVVRYCTTPHARSSLLLVKVGVTLALLRQGCRSLFAEMDVFLVRPPLALVDPALDLQVSRHVHNDELNVGFIVAQPGRDALLRTLELLLAWAVGGAGVVTRAQRTRIPVRSGRVRR